MQEANKACHRTRQDNYINVSELNILDFESNRYNLYSADVNIIHREASTSKPTSRNPPKGLVSTFLVSTFLVSTFLYPTKQIQLQIIPSGPDQPFPLPHSTERDRSPRCPTLSQVPRTTTVPQPTAATARLQPDTGIRQPHTPNRTAQQSYVPPSKI